MRSQHEVLLINPWIYDFAAYNLWIEPLGLLTIAAVLRARGFGVTVIDCLAPDGDSPAALPDGSGKLRKAILDSPEAVSFVPRRYGRYGLPLERFDTALRQAPRPDVVFVSSGMTYWYPGVIAVTSRLRAADGDVPIALGGVYASLCPDHARRHSGANQVIVGPGILAAIRYAERITGAQVGGGSLSDPKAWPAPARELVPRPYAALLTSWGCPWRCTYCASHSLQPAFVQKTPASVVEEIAGCARRGIHDFAFYDDALLVDAPRHLVPILETVLARGIEARFHTPNGLHAREITAPLAKLMRTAGFSEVRLSLESSDRGRQQTTGGKVSTEAFFRAVEHLQAAGFPPWQITAYVLAGLPGQPLSEVETTLRLVHERGIRARLALFSPIPGTPDGDRALPPGADPLRHNNTVYPYLLGSDYVRDLQQLKQAVKDSNASLGGNSVGATAA